jgi:hypothetical protein
MGVLINLIDLPFYFPPLLGELSGEADTLKSASRMGVFK